MGKALEKDLLWRVDRRRRRRCGPGIRSRVPHGTHTTHSVREQPHPSTCWRELSCVVEVVCRVHARWYSVLTHWPVIVSVCRVWEVDAQNYRRHSPRRTGSDRLYFRGVHRRPRGPAPPAPPRRAPARIAHSESPNIPASTLRTNATARPGFTQCWRNLMCVYVCE